MTTREPTKKEKKKKGLIKKISFLASLGEEYTVRATNGNYTLDSELFKDKTFSSGDYTAEDLRFIRKVRRYIINNSIYLLPQFEQQYFKRDVSYLGVKKAVQGTTYDSLMEVDIDEAYWKTARLLEIISQDIYEEGQKGTIEKKTRLTALGSLAKKTTIYRLKGKVLVAEPEVESDPLLENLWFTICKRIGDVMYEVSQEIGDDYIFFWVDGIYMKANPESVQIAIDIFNAHGYDTKTKSAESIEFTEKGFTVWDTKTEKRDFNYPHYATDKKIEFAEAENIKELARKVLVENYDILGNIENINA